MINGEMIMSLKGNELVEKKNELNEIPIDKMNFIETRIFLIYLAKINPRNKETRIVRIALDDIYKDLNRGRVNIEYLKIIAESLHSKIIYSPLISGGFQSFPMFSVCTVDKDKCGKWYMEIDVHDNAIPLLFDFKDKYFRYQIWNILKLESTNQIIMYNQLKQYEWIGKREITIRQLRIYLGVEDGKYLRWDHFRTRVLLSCQKALAENTDICFTFEPVRVGRNHETVAVKFFIEKNKKFMDPVVLPEYADEQKYAAFGEERVEISPEKKSIDMEFLSEAFSNEFNLGEVEYLYRLALPYLQWNKPNIRSLEVQLEADAKLIR